MERGSNPVSRRKDDEMKHELQGYLRSGQHTHAEDAVDPEPEADDDIRPAPSGPVPPPGPEREQAEREAAAHELHLEMARHLDRTVFPADRDTLVRALRDRQAPDALVEAAEALPEKGMYHNAHEIVVALRDRSAL
ncbi:DUF2795 domain-containing protein [Streptomyces sp. NPDC046831]|uniref:DUF2795 domain-containing protein n=1 Tax=Streptomyces sp. NPDC046831 TaxID=3154805 RepID=UPI00340DB450